MVCSILLDVVNPLKFLELLPQELTALKIIIFFSCGNHTNQGGWLFKPWNFNLLEDISLPISIASRMKMIACKNRVISALFAYYK